MCSFDKPKTANSYLGVGFEGDFCRTSRASNVESEDGDCIVFLVGGLFPRVEFTAFVDVFAAGGTSHREGCHETDGLYFGADLFGTSLAFDLGGIEVRRVVFGEDLSFRHGY